MRRRHRLLVAASLLAPACSASAATRGRHETSATPPAEAGLAATAAAATSAGPAPTSSVDAASPPASTGPTTSEAPTTTVTVTLPPTTRVAPRTTTTFVVPERVDEDLTDEEWWANQPGYRAQLLACIRQWEQNRDPRKGPVGYASDTGNGFYGAYQFDLPTWRSVGGSGNPAHAEPAEQDARAWTLFQRRGLQPWPTPDARCAG